MAKASAQLQAMRREQWQQNPGRNHLPTAGQSYPEGDIAYEIMVASADGIGIWIEVDYLDEDGVAQRRLLGKGVWPLMTSQINGYRPHRS